MMKKVYYDYHWDRIFGAIVGLFLLLSAASYAVYSLVETGEPQGAIPVETPFVSSNQETAPQDHSRPGMSENPWMAIDKQQQSNSSNIAESSPSIAESGLSSPQIPDNPSYELVQSYEFAQFQPSISEENSLSVLEAVDESPPTGGDTEQSPISREPIEKALIKPDTNLVSLSDKPQPIQLQAPDPFASLQQSEPATPVNQPDANNNQTFHLQEIKKFSPSVKRFTLAQAIKDKEPTGTVDSISMDSKGVAIIYAFSEIVDMRGRMLHYYWYHEGDPVAKVPMHIGSNGWRSNSSKYINNNMQGAWSVELHSDDGQILASANFFNGAQRLLH